MLEFGHEHFKQEPTDSVREEVEDAAKEALVHVMNKHKLPLALMTDTAERLLEGLRSYRRENARTDELGQLKMLSEKIVHATWQHSLGDVDVLVSEFKNELEDRLPA